MNKSLPKSTDERLVDLLSADAIVVVGDKVIGTVPDKMALESSVMDTVREARELDKQLKQVEKELEAKKKVIKTYMIDEKLSSIEVDLVITTLTTSERRNLSIDKAVEKLGEEQFASLLGDLVTTTTVNTLKLKA